MKIKILKRRKERESLKKMSKNANFINEIIASKFNITAENDHEIDHKIASSDDNKVLIDRAEHLKPETTQIILQGEFLIQKKKKKNADSNSNSSSKITHVGTIDCTSCICLILETKNDVILTHLDGNEEQIDVNLRQIVGRFMDRKSDQGSSNIVEMQYHLIGGMNDKSTLKILKKLATFFNSIENEYSTDKLILAPSKIITGTDNTIIRTTKDGNKLFPKILNVCYDLRNNMINYFDLNSFNNMPFSQFSEQFIKNFKVRSARMWIECLIDMKSIENYLKKSRGQNDKDDAENHEFHYSNKLIYDCDKFYFPDIRLDVLNPEYINWIKNCLDDMMKPENFVTLSTTPHCEPSHFWEVLKGNFEFIRENLGRRIRGEWPDE